MKIFGETSKDLTKSGAGRAEAIKAFPARTGEEKSFAGGVSGG